MQITRIVAQNSKNYLSTNNAQKLQNQNKVITTNSQQFYKRADRINFTGPGHERELLEEFYRLRDLSSKEGISVEQKVKIRKDLNLLIDWLDGLIPDFMM